MSSFEVNTNELKRIAGTENKITSKLAKINDDILRISRSVKLDSVSEQKIKTNLKLLVSSNSKNIEKIISLSDALQKIATCYENAERNLAGTKSESKKNSFAAEFTNEYNVKDVIKSFGNAGKAYGLIDGALNAKSWNQWTSISISGWKLLSNLAKDYKHYKKIGRAIGTKNSMLNLLKKEIGFRKVGHPSVFKNDPIARFHNNLHNSTSPYRIGKAFEPLTGKNGFGTTVAAWAGVVMTGVSNAFSNLEEQKKSKGSMSNERVVAETISETAIDTIVTYGAGAVVGAAIAATTGVIAAPAVVAIVTGVGIAGINAGVATLTGKTATEWVSDAILDTAINVGKGVSNVTKSTVKWFGSLSLAW